MTTTELLIDSLVEEALDLIKRMKARQKMPSADMVNSLSKLINSISKLIERSGKNNNVRTKDNPLDPEEYVQRKNGRAINPNL